MNHCKIELVVIFRNILMSLTQIFMDNSSAPSKLKGVPKHEERKPERYIKIYSALAIELPESDVSDFI